VAIVIAYVGQAQNQTQPEHSVKRAARATTALLASHACNASIQECTPPIAYPAWNARAARSRTLFGPSVLRVQLLVLARPEAASSVRWGRSHGSMHSLVQLSQIAVCCAPTTHSSKTHVGGCPRRASSAKHARQVTLPMPRTLFATCVSRGRFHRMGKAVCTARPAKSPTRLPLALALHRAQLALMASTGTMTRRVARSICSLA
jgi:hypothetical protein